MAEQKKKTTSKKKTPPKKAQNTDPNKPKNKGGRPTAISKLAEEADRRGFALVEKNGVKGLTSVGYHKTEAEGVAKYIEHATVSFFTQIDLNDFSAVCDAAAKYYQDCETADIPPTMAGLCLRLGITKNEFQRWSNGQTRDHRYRELAQRCSAINEAVTSELALQNKINNIAAIVQLKNHYGYTDEQKVVVESKESVVDDTMQMADVLALANTDTPQKAKYKEIDKQGRTE